MAFDGIVTKAITSELQNVIGARIDKIYEPNKNDIILGFYLNGMNYALNVCTNSQNYRIHLTTHSKPNPQNAPNFCMLLRKHLIGLRIKNIISTNLERVITIEFEGFDEVDDIIIKKLMKHFVKSIKRCFWSREENTISSIQETPLRLSAAGGGGRSGSRIPPPERFPPECFLRINPQSVLPGQDQGRFLLHGGWDRPGKIFQKYASVPRESCRFPCPEFQR